MKTLGIYIHIPFCIKKCIYCDFLSFPGKYEFAEKYVSSLCAEIEEKSDKFKDYSVDTIFIGGGTPSSIDSKLICKVTETLYGRFNVTDNCEFTIEANPGTLSQEKCSDYVKYGINRMSIGLQSADPVILKFLGRIHTYEEYAESVLNAKKAGFKNINTDLIFGIPGQTVDSFYDTLCKVTNLDIQHISAYSLIPEENTPLYNLLESKQIEYPDDGQDREMYKTAREFLSSKGFVQYEISNFAKPGFESKHNLKYWEEKEYLGLGLGAASFYGHYRTKNTTDFYKYIKGENNLEENIYIDEKEEQNEFMMLGFRKIKGPDINVFKDRYGKDVFEIFGDKLNMLHVKNLLDFKYNNCKIDKVALSDKGLDFANEVFEEFI